MEYGICCIDRDLVHMAGQAKGLSCHIFLYRKFFWDFMQKRRVKHNTNQSVADRKGHYYGI